MDPNTITLHLQDGCFQRIESPDGRLAGYPVAIVIDGQPERVAAMKLVLTNEIERYVRTYRACDLSGAWHGVDDGRDVVCAAARDVIETAGELVACMHVPIGSRFERRDLAELLTDTDHAGPIDAAKLAAERMLAAISGFRAARGQAAETLADERSSAAHGEHHQQPRVAIKHKEPADV